MASGSMSGSSPCRFTTISGAGRSFRAASATRSVPVAAGPVMMAVAPARSAAAAMRWSSVATATTSTPRARRARSTT